MLPDSVKTILKDKYPNTKFHPVKIGEQIFVLRKPSSLEWERFEADDSNQDAKMLVKTCVVYPDEQQLEKLMDEFYAIHKPLADVIGKLVGIQKAVELESF
jgi:hypothetical protein